MRVKFLLFGEAVNIPYTTIGLGVGAVSVWVDDVGFTSASNQLGALGYVLLDAPEVDVGEPPEETRQAFADLHGQAVRFEVAPTLFAKDGGIARIALVRAVAADGGLVERRVEFVASDCRGICVVSNPLTFTAEMMALPREVAASDALAEDDLVAIADGAPGEVAEQGVG